MTYRCYVEYSYEYGKEQKAPYEANMDQPPFNIISWLAEN